MTRLFRKKHFMGKVAAVRAMIHGVPKPSPKLSLQEQLWTGLRNCDLFDFPKPSHLQVKVSRSLPGIGADPNGVHTRLGDAGKQ